MGSQEGQGQTQPLTVFSSVFGSTSDPLLGLVPDAPALTLPLRPAPCTPQLLGGPSAGEPQPLLVGPAGQSLPGKWDEDPGKG